MFHHRFVKVNPGRLAVKLKSTAERIFREGHPWIFSESIHKVNKIGNAGDLAVIYGRKGNSVIGLGLFDPSSAIRIKVLHNAGSAVIDRLFFAGRIETAFSLRGKLLQTATNSYRLIYGENDGFPGFIADVYDQVLVVKLYSAIWFPYLELILEELVRISGCACIVLRLSRNLQRDSLYGLSDGQVLYGELKNEVVEFVEHGIRFAANVVKGHKTGYFLDHRHNRKKVGELSRAKTVLDVFSYTGGFSVHALANGAKEVTSVDISQHALEAAVENANLNNYTGRHLTIAGDAFSVLESLVKQGRTFDIVVIDPPSFAKSKKEIDLARKKYMQLAGLGSRLTATDGLLVLASCSSRVTAEDFFKINEEALMKRKRHFKLWATTAHDSDHPVSFKEGAYLKCGYYRMD